jgi:hypothetical protein
MYQVELRRFHLTQNNLEANVVPLGISELEMSPVPGVFMHECEDGAYEFSASSL